MSSAEQRLQVVQNALMGVPPSLLILPDGKKVNLRCQEGLQRKDTTTLVPLDVEITLDDVPLCLLRTSGRNAMLIISGVGTPYEHTTSHIPQYPVLEVHSPKSTGTTSAKAHISLPDMWTIIYALFTKYHDQENIPIVLAAEMTNGEELRSYILRSGLGRTSPSQRASPKELFLMRATFWQGAGQIGFHERGWLPPLPSANYARSCFPFVQSFTRTPLVIAAHPLRPPKPEQGEVLYKRYCPTVGQTLEFTYFDLGTDGSVSAHLQAFHRWHNEERVNKFWGEAGSLQQHREYIVRAMNDPAKLPVMMSWDGELMGYLEVIWVKEDHVATYIPNGAKDWDRGIHVLVGEERFRGSIRAQAWLRSLHHYCFLAEPRTDRVLAEPRADNAAILKVFAGSSMHTTTVFDFPYKRSALIGILREHFFKMDAL